MIGLKSGFSCVLLAAGSTVAVAAPRVPAGVYTTFITKDVIKQAQTAAYPSTLPADLPPYPNPNVTPDPTDAVLVNYFTALLNNPAVAGLAPQFAWYLLNPGNPGPDPAHPASGAYTWNALDDVFTAVDQWNRSHPFAPPKGIQLLVSPGFNSPDWIYNDIDKSVCGSSKGNCGSCDRLFESPQPAVSPICGYTTFFYQVEAGPVVQENFPLPWNQVYKDDFGVFLAALNQHVQQEPSSSAFNSIAMGGPSATSDEMILPSTKDQNVNNNGAMNSLPSVPAGETALVLRVPDAWNLLIVNFYGAGTPFENTDQPFIDEWDNTIDLYGRTFGGITLMLVTTTDALPDFPNAAPDQSVAAPGFTSDCGITTEPNMEQCAAVTEVLVHFTNPTVGGNNAKLVFEAGMTAARDGLDLGTNGIRWLAFITASGRNPLPGTPYNMSRILGGLQFSHSFSSTALQGPDPGDTDIQATGCPTYPNPLCPNLSPDQGYLNVMQDSYFVGTAVAPLWGASPSVTYGNWVYANAPMNFLQVYDVDILFASGLENCSTLQITGSPANHIGPDPASCALTPLSSDWWSAINTQAELDLTALSLALTAEGPNF